MFNDEDDEEATMGAVRYPVMPSLVALQQMRNRLHLAYLGKKLMKWTAMATSKELRRIAIEISDNLKEYGTKIQLGFILLARARYFVPHINTTVLECIPKCATITVKTQPRSVSGVKVRNLYAEDSDVDPYPYLGLNNGGMCIANCKDLWEELVKLMILIVQYKITFVLIEQAHKAANKKQNVLSRCIIPRILITMHYILSELDEREREETFRLKRFKQLKYKGKKADPKEPLEREADVPAPKKPGPEPCPVCAAEEPPPKEPGPEPCPVCAVEEPPPKPAYVPPKAEPKKEIVSAPQVETFTCPLCQMEEAEDSTLRIGVCEQGPPRTAPPKDRLEHLLVHINQLIQLVEQLTAEQQLPCGKKHYIMKCCEGMKFKIEELSSPPPPCEVCMSAKQSVAASVPPTPRPCEVCTTAPLPPVPQPLPKSVPSSPPPCEVCMSAKQSVAASVPPTPRPCDVCTTAPLPPVPQPLPKSVPSSPPPCEVCMSAKQSVVASVPPTPRPCDVCTTAPLPPVPQPLPKSVPSSPPPCEVCMSAKQSVVASVPPTPRPCDVCMSAKQSVAASVPPTPPPCEVCMSAKQPVAASVPPTPRPCGVCTTAPLPPVPKPLPKSVPSSPPPCEVCMSAKQSVVASVPPTPRPCAVCMSAKQSVAASVPPTPPPCEVCMSAKQPVAASVPPTPRPCDVCMSAKQSVAASVPPTPPPCEVCMSAKQPVAASVPPTPRPCGVCTTAPLPPVPQPLPKSVPSSPLPCEVCMSAAQQFEQPVPEPRPLPISPCATLPASVTSSCIPSICGRLVPSEKVSKTAPPCHVPPDASSQRSVLPKGSTISKQKHKLGYFETEYKEIVRVTRSLNPDGTLSEEKQIITVKTERTNPRRKGKKGSDEGYATPCRRSDSDYGGGGGFSTGGGGTTTTDNNRSDKDGGVKSKASERQGRDCTGGSHRGTGGDGMGGGGGREMNKPCSEGGVCRSESIHVAAIDYTGSCGGVGKGPHAGAPKTPSVSSCCRSPATVISAPSPPPPTAPSPCAFCGRPPTAPRTLPSTVPAPTPIKTIGLPPPKPCFDGGICKNEPPPADTKIPSCQNSGNSIKSGKPKTDGGARKPGTNETASKASRSSIVIRTCKDCGVCTIRESTNDSGYSTGTSFASGSQSTYDDNCRCDAVCGSRTVVTEYVTSICQSGEDDLDGLRKDCRTIGCGSSLYHTSTFLSGFNPHPPGFSYPPRGPPVTKSTSTTLTFNNNKSTNGCACKARTGTDKNCKMTSTSASETSSVQSRFLSPVAKLKDFYCGTDVSMSMKCVSAATSAQSCWQPETKKMSDKRTFCIPDCSTKGGVSSVNESLVVTTLKRGGEFSLPTLCSSDASKSIKARSLTNTSFSIEIASKSPTSCTDLNKDSNIQYVIKGYPLNALRKMLMPRSISTQCSEVTLVSVVDSSCLCYHAKSATSCPKCSIRLQNNPACYTYVELRDFNLENETCVSCGTLGQLSTPSATTLTESTAIPCSPSPKTSRQSRSNSSGNSLFSGCKSICAAIAKQIAKCTSPLPQEICCPKPGVIKTLKVIPKQIPIPMLDAMTSTKRCDRFDCRPLLAFNNNHTCAKIRKEVCACHSDSHVCKKIDKCSMLQQSKSYSSDLYSRY